jgi:hypothetical protein
MEIQFVSVQQSMATGNLIMEGGKRRGTGR